LAFIKCFGDREGISSHTVETCRTLDDVRKHYIEISEEKWYHRSVKKDCLAIAAGSRASITIERAWFSRSIANTIGIASMNDSRKREQQENNSDKLKVNHDIIQGEKR
jgi:hypothetical protein